MLKTYFPETRELVDGVYVAALTPMRSDFSWDHQKLAAHCFALLEQGCRGIVLFGTTGEGPSFSTAERIDILQKLLAEGFDPKKLIVANGSSNIPDTVELGREALKFRCAALLIAPPSFYKNVDDAGVLAFYREIIQKIAAPNLPVILYHIPQYSSVAISLHVIENLCKEFPSIVIGMKESEGNLSFTKEILKEFPRFKVFVGNERHIVESVHLGGAGTICGIANLYPKMICSLYSQGKLGDFSSLAPIESVFNALKGMPFIGAAKSLMERREGESWQIVRPPLVPLNAMQKDLFFNALLEAKLN